MCNFVCCTIAPATDLQGSSTVYKYLLHRHECFTGNIPLVKSIKTTSGTRALLTFCHCRALFSSVLFLKMIVNNVLYCCTVNLSRHNYFLHWRIKIYYFIDVFFFCLYNKKNITRRLEDMNLIFSWQKQYFTHSLRFFIKYCFATRK